MFRITDKKGFHLTFDNGYTVSVQFGPGNYCENYNMKIGREEEKAGAQGSSTAECAVWGPDGSFINHDLFDGDVVGEQLKPADVLSLMNWAAEQKDIKEAP